MNSQIENCPLRAKEIFSEHMQRTYSRIDRMFVVLMFVQWAFAVGCALVLTPYTWEGVTRSPHPHVWLATVLGGLLTLPAAGAGLLFPGRCFTRHTIALCQVGFSSLLIHVTGGRIETHFHVFGSLAFLAAYRDWWVLVPPTLFVAVDHLLRGMFWPETVFGIVIPSNWRWLEHAGWVLFEDLFLIICCQQGLREVQDIARHRAKLERSHTVLQEKTLAAEAASHAKSLFLANMSHEIRTPLNVILGYTDLLRSSDSAISSGERMEHLDAVSRSGNHLLAVINDILDLSKIEAGQMQYERVAFSPHQAILEVLSLMRVRATEKGLTLDARWLSRVPATIQTDPARVRQLLLNLVGNALKFTERGSVQVLARFRASEELLEFAVIDTGVGIAADKLHSIFAPFTQADVSVTRRFGGTGLGLSICRHIATALGGEISVESQPGQGSTFRVTIATGNMQGVPLLDHPPAEAVQAGVPTADSPTRLAGLQILVVDDAEPNRRLLKLLLTRAGATVETADNGLAALEKIRQRQFDVVLMDMQMPLLDGYSATRELRAEGNTTTIIALTAHALHGEDAKCRAAGCDGYLTKPVDRSLLIATLAQLQRSGPDDECDQAPSDDPSVSESFISELDQSDPEVREIVSDFASRLPDDLAQIQAAIQQGDWEVLERLVHSLKGTAAMTGFVRLSDVAAEFEEVVRLRASGSIPGAFEHLAAIGDQVTEHARACSLTP
jgi:signal transduction histidine kinase/DNA-binding response OmpR family regulator